MDKVAIPLSGDYYRGTKAAVELVSMNPASYVNLITVLTDGRTASNVSLEPRDARALSAALRRVYPDGTPQPPYRVEGARVFRVEEETRHVGSYSNPETAQAVADALNKEAA